MNPSENIGSALRRARTARGMSLNDVASGVGISVATLSRIETDKQNVDVPMLLTLSRILHVTAASLLGDGADVGVDRNALAQDLAALSSSQRTQVMAEALKHARDGGRSRETIDGRVDNLLSALDVMEEELHALQRDLKRRGRR